MGIFVSCCSKLLTRIRQLFKQKNQQQKALIDEQQLNRIELQQIKKENIQKTQEKNVLQKIQLNLLNHISKKSNTFKLSKKQSLPDRIRSQDDSQSMVSMISNPSIMKKSFKSLSKRRRNSMSSSKPKNQSPSNSAFKSIKNFDDLLCQPIMFSADSKHDKYSQYFIEWNKRQYKSSSTNIYKNLSQGERIKIQNQSLLDEAVNQLQDYYTFYLNQTDKRSQSSEFSGFYYNKGLSLKCSYHLQDQNILTNSYMKMVSFTCNTENPIKFLEWYNSVVTQGFINNFYNISLLDNGQFPILEVQQFGIDIVGKNIYTLVRQIEMVKFDNQIEKQHMIQLDTTIGKGKKFKSLLKFDIAQTGNVEIYWQCNEDIKTNKQQYFEKMWKRLEQRLVKDKILQLYISNKYYK